MAARHPPPGPRLRFREGQRAAGEGHKGRADRRRGRRPSGVVPPRFLEQSLCDWLSLVRLTAEVRHGPARPAEVKRLCAAVRVVCVDVRVGRGACENKFWVFCFPPVPRRTLLLTRTLLRRPRAPPTPSLTPRAIPRSLCVEATARRSQQAELDSTRALPRVALFPARATTTHAREHQPRRLSHNKMSGAIRACPSVRPPSVPRGAAPRREIPAVAESRKPADPDGPPPLTPSSHTLTPRSPQLQAAG